jgi:hypothetical protein
MSSMQACWRSLAYCSRFDSRLSRLSEASRSSSSASHSAWPRLAASPPASMSEGLGHAVQAESVEQIEGRMIQQGGIS